MDIEATKKYYSQMTKEDVCECEGCQTFLRGIKAAYPAFAEYLMTMGAEIDKPFEIMLPEETDDGYLIYHGVQYLIAGACDGFTDTKIGDISVYNTKYHPAAAYQGEHFVIEAGAFRLKRQAEKYNR